jgi:transposase
MSSESRNKGGRPPALGREHLEVLRVVVQEKPVCSLEELRRRFVERSGVPVSGPTLRKALKAAGIVRHRPPRTPRSGLEASPKRRYGYTEAHRDEGESDRYAGGLTEAEWALGEDLFAAADARGRPPRYARRELVNACCYVLRTGCAWRLLPKDFPPWPAVYKAFSRWAARGVFEQFHDRLRAQWRERLGKHAVPTAAIPDSQSTRISPQGGESGYDAGKKVKGRKRHLLVDTPGLVADRGGDGGQRAGSGRGVAECGHRPPEISHPRQAVRGWRLRRGLRPTAARGSWVGRGGGAPPR